MIKVLKEYVGHHVNEEQRKMFPRVKRAELDLEAIGRELMERKTELESELASATADDDAARRTTRTNRAARVARAAAWRRATTRL